MVETASKSVNATSDFKATQNLKEAKTLLYNTYDQLKEQEIKEKIHRVENLPDDSRYGEAWVVINEITGRKKTIEGQVAGASPEERVKTWYNHFRNLLGSTPETEELEDVDMILAEGNISDDPFSPEEYIKVKISLKQGKSSGPDEIPPEKANGINLVYLEEQLTRVKKCSIFMVRYSPSSDSHANNILEDFWAKFLHETLNPALWDVGTALNQFSTIGERQKAASRTGQSTVDPVSELAVCDSWINSMLQKASEYYLSRNRQPIPRVHIFQKSD
ncbi:hypothetical protein CAPTEDRAFT_186252 [Capitella teleta]|uniref:Uncharacterized protein n=1 Tax=Capitella teleta TaxID=283909 RepID=R7T6S9_CAPTE|nr:hypothetical protein CAPTEDRAFT_186252 [Capitella teleta]|eukprot:ELT89220.1 hypothetical protein CAPTEDRAFT_186252 [Capitella teleta]